MRLLILLIAVVMTAGAYGVWRWARSEPRPVPEVAVDAVAPAETAAVRAAASEPAPPEPTEWIVVAPEIEIPFEPKIAGTTQDSPLVAIPPAPSPRFDAEGERGLRMPRADEPFDWAPVRRRLEERSVIVFFEPLPVLPMPERIAEESDDPSDEP